MKVASALVAGHRAEPDLAAAAVRQALAGAGLERAAAVVLLLSREFSRHPQAAVLAAARAAGCLQVAGSTAHGVFTESGWQLDQPAAAAMVFGEGPAAPAELPLISLAGGSTLPYDWRSGPPRAGLLGSEAVCWQGGRISGNDQASFAVPAAASRLVRSTGLRRLGEPQAVSRADGFELQAVAGHTALDSLRRALPVELREQPPLHHVVAVRAADQPAIGILSANADGALSLTERLLPGELLSWAIRQPLSAEQDMRDALAAVDGEKAPDFALMFSCIGRGPLFYGGDDRDLLAFRQRFPGVPLLGAYGSGQIAPSASGNSLFQNTVVTLLCESTHV